MSEDQQRGRGAPGLEREARPAAGASTAHEDGDLSRRELLKIVGATSALVAAHMMLPGEWTRPVVDVGALPAHAQTSGGRDAGAGADASVPGFTLSASRNIDGTVTLSWTTPAGVESLELYRKADGQAEERIAVADSAAATMIDHSAQSGKLTYRGQISAGSASASVAGAQ